MDVAKAQFVYFLLSEYDQAVPHLKALGAHMRGEIALTDAEQEAHRRGATQWFNRVYNLLAGGWIDQRMFVGVASRAHARMYVARVADLDAAIRKARGEKADAPMNPVEWFWREYADGRLHVPTRPRWQRRFLGWLFKERV